MKAVVQRVRDARVIVDGQVVGSIPAGLLVYLGVAHGDADADADRLAAKIAWMRIFEDDAGKMNLGVKDVAGQVLAVSQFTLLADTSHGRRPYFGAAAPPGDAKRLYERFMDHIRAEGVHCEAGVFQAHMEVSYVNDGPVTILLDSRDPA